MRAVWHNTVEGFLAQTEDWLLCQEAENSLILGMCSRLLAHRQRYPQAPLLVAAEDDDRAVGAAVMAPGQDLVVGHGEPETIRRLAESLAELDVPVAAVSGPAPAAETFARCWAVCTGTVPRLAMHQRLFECRRVVPPERSPGTLRPAGPDDVDRLALWRRAYHDELGFHDREEHRLVVESRIARRELFVWEDDAPVSMAGCGDATPHTVRLFLVYTPPEHRQSGYATSCVAALTGQLLAADHRACLLSADAANPVANAIYRKIGYREVCDCQRWSFDDE